MSAEAARIISKIKSKGQAGGTPMALGTIKGVSPLTLQLDDVDFEISKGLLVNHSLLQHSRSGNISSSEISLSNATISVSGALTSGDRVLVARVSNACNVILCKVVSG